MSGNIRRGSGGGTRTGSAPSTSSKDHRSLATMTAPSPDTTVRLNETRQCPYCLRKPLVYKRDRLYYCGKCHREYRWCRDPAAPADGVWIPNWHWIEPNKEKPHPVPCHCGHCPTG